MVSFDDLVRKHGRVKLYDDVCVEHIGFYAVESRACMGFIVYRDFEMIGAGSTVLEAMRSAGEGLRLEHPAAAVPESARHRLELMELVKVMEEKHGMFMTQAQAELRLLRGNVKAVCGAVEAMRTAGGSREFQAAFDAAKVLAAALAANKESSND